MRPVLRAALALPVLLIAAAPALATETITYSYDARGRLIAVSHAGTVNDGWQTTYSHDKADNRTQVVRDDGTAGLRLTFNGGFRVIKG